MKLEINNRENWKMHILMEIKQHTLKKLVNQKNIREIRKHLLINENENTAYQNL